MRIERGSKYTRDLWLIINDQNAPMVRRPLLSGAHFASCVTI